jgi:hypothetical protein
MWSNAGCTPGYTPTHPARPSGRPPKVPGRKREPSTSPARCWTSPIFLGCWIAFIHVGSQNGPTESLRYSWETSCGYPEAKLKHIWRCSVFAPNHLNYAREVNVFVTSKDWTSMDWWETSKKPWWFHRSFDPSRTGKFIFCEVNLHWFHEIKNWKLQKKTRSNHLLILKFHFSLFHKLFWVEIHPRADSIQLKATSCLPRLGRGAQQ